MSVSTETAPEPVKNAPKERLYSVLEFSIREHIAYVSPLLLELQSLSRMDI